MSSRRASADVVVVGGGLVGTSLAYELACADLSVVLIDAPLGGRASDAGAGIASPETWSDPDETWFAFGAEAARHLRALVPRLSEDGVEVTAETFTECGSLVLALAEHEDRWFEEVRQLAIARDPSIEEVAEDDARGLFPPLGPMWRAIHSPSAARLDGRSLCGSIRAAAGRRGVSVLSAEALGVDRQGERVTAVRTANEVVPCDAMVLATGAWSGGTAKWLGLHLPVAPTKGQIVHLRLQAGPAEIGANSGRWPIVQPILNFYLVPWPGGRVACGGTFEADAGFDVRPTAMGMRDLLRECIVMAPKLGAASFLEVRVGLRPTSTDDRPLLGPVPGTTNVHVCTGHGPNGLLLGPYSAAVVAAGIVGSPSPALATYGVGRFARDVTEIPAGE